ncbi:MtnX-like HAD-IB family phosphatase [Persephonella sp.]
MSWIFFSDFDGTITQQDVIGTIMENFAPPEWKDIYTGLMEGKIDIDVGIRMMFNLIPAEKLESIKEFVLDGIKIREGFGELLDYLREKDIPFVILSGGLDFYIYLLMEPYLDKIHRIHSNRLIVREGKLDVRFYYRCGVLCKRNCGICKPYVIENYYKNHTLRMYAGDGITDLDASQFNDIIFSTGGLEYYLKKLNLRGKRVIKFETFFDVIKSIEEYGEGISS